MFVIYVWHYALLVVPPEKKKKSQSSKFDRQNMKKTVTQQQRFSQTGLLLITVLGPSYLTSQ